MVLLLEETARIRQPPRPRPPVRPPMVGLLDPTWHSPLALWRQHLRTVRPSSHASLVARATREDEADTKEPGANAENAKPSPCVPCDRGLRWSNAIGVIGAVPPAAAAKPLPREDELSRLREELNKLQRQAGAVVLLEARLRAQLEAVPKPERHTFVSPPCRTPSRTAALRMRLKRQAGVSPSPSPSRKIKAKATAEVATSPLFALVEANPINGHGDTAVVDVHAGKFEWSSDGNLRSHVDAARHYPPCQPLSRPMDGWRRCSMEKEADLSFDCHEHVRRVDFVGCGGTGAGIAGLQLYDLTANDSANEEDDLQAAYSALVAPWCRGAELLGDDSISSISSAEAASVVAHGEVQHGSSPLVTVSGDVSSVEASDDTVSTMVSGADLTSSDDASGYDGAAGSNLLAQLETARVMPAAPNNEHEAATSREQRRREVDRRLVRCGLIINSFEPKLHISSTDSSNHSALDVDRVAAKAAPEQPSEAEDDKSKNGTASLESSGLHISMTSLAPSLVASPGRVPSPDESARNSAASPALGQPRLRRFSLGAADRRGSPTRSRGHEELAEKLRRRLSIIEAGGLEAAAALLGMEVAGGRSISSGEAKSRARSSTMWSEELAAKLSRRLSRMQEMQ